RVCRQGNTHSSYLSADQAKISRTHLSRTGALLLVALLGPRELPAPQRVVSRRAKYGKSAIFSLICGHIAPYSAMTRQTRIVAPACCRCAVARRTQWREK